MQTTQNNANLNQENNNQQIELGIQIIKFLIEQKFEEKKILALELNLKLPEWTNIQICSLQAATFGNGNNLLL